MKFYDCKNKEISKSDFLKIYSNIYFYENPLSLEESITPILNDGISNEYDIDTILSWKLGDLFKPITSIVEGKHEAMVRSYKVNLQTVYNIVIEKNGKDLFNAAAQIKGLGPIFTTTLLFFKSQMRYPIVDKFAYVALNAIMKEDKITVPQEYHYQPNPEMFWKKYEDYQKDLNTVFGKAYQTDRTIDQALWAYGHMFKIEES